MNDWHYTNAGAQAGPVSLEQLTQWVQAGQLPPDTYVWRNGMPSWLPAREVPELAYLYTAAATPAAGTFVQPAAGSLSYESPGQGTVFLSGRALGMLQQTKPWVRLFSILLFIGMGLMGIVALIQLIGAVAIGSSRSPFGRAAGGVVVMMALFMLAVAALNLIPAIFLGRYASRIGDLLRFRRPQDLEAALEAQKSYWKFLGIVFIIGVALYLLVILIAFVGFRRF